jgi:hypothetical protein
LLYGLRGMFIDVFDVLRGLKVAGNVIDVEFYKFYGFAKGLIVYKILLWLREGTKTIEAEYQHAIL